MAETGSSTVSDLVEQIENDECFLPGIQRDLVWDENKICKLFDSVMRQYPIGEFIFWEDTSGISNNQIIYDFIKHKLYDRRINPSNVDFKMGEVNPHYRNPLLKEEKINSLSSSDISPRLVIDGQQRLSSFYIGINGSIVNKNGQNKLLYFDLLTYGRRDNIGRDELRYRFEFKNRSDDIYYQEPSSDIPPRLWLRVGHLTEVKDDMIGEQELKNTYKNSEAADRVREDIVSSEEFSKYYEDDFKYDDADELREKIESFVILNNMDRLYTSVVKRDDVIRYTEIETDKTDEVLNVFVRTNVEAEILDEEDVILAVMTNRWSKYGVNAGEVIKSFKEEIEDKYNSGYHLSVKDILKSLAMCSKNLGVSYSLSDFKGENLEESKNIWEEGNLQDAIKDSIDVLKKLGFSHNVMSRYFSVQLPIIYLFYENPDLTVTWDENRDILRKLQMWVCLALIHGDDWSEYSDQRNDDIREMIKDSGEQYFPLRKIREEAKKNNWNASFTLRRSDIRNAISNRDSIYRSGSAYAVFSLMYFPRTAEHSSYAKDHLHPESLMSELELEETGLDEYESEVVNGRKDSVTNHQFIHQNMNEDKGDMELSDWLDDKSTDYLEKHMIPHKSGDVYDSRDINIENSMLWSRENYQTFENLREKKIVNKLVNRFNDMYTDEEFSKLFER